MFDWLCEISHLHLNLAALSDGPGTSSWKRTHRLWPGETALLREAIAARPDATREGRLSKARDLFEMDLFERKGLRASKAVACEMEHVVVDPVPTVRRENTRMRRRSPTAVRWVPPDEIALSLQSYWIAFSVPPMPLPDDHLSLLLLVQGTKFGLGVDLAKRRSSSLFSATRISGQIPDFVNKVRDLPGV